MYRPVIGSLSDSSNVFVVGGMSGFGVMGRIVCVLYQSHETAAIAY